MWKTCEELLLSTPLIFHHLCVVPRYIHIRAPASWGPTVENWHTNLLTNFFRSPMLDITRHWSSLGPNNDQQLTILNPQLDLQAYRPMQLNVERLQYHLAAALSEYADMPAPHPLAEKKSTPRIPKGELKRPLQTRLTILQHDQVRWIAPRLNMTMADFARRSIEAMLEHIVEANPHILFDDIPEHEAPPAEDPQLDLFRR